MESDKEDDVPSGGLLGSAPTTNPTSLADLPVVSKTVQNPEIKATQRHLLYSLHLPLPQDSSFEHEINQRHTLLYGVGKAKDDARYAVKKVNKEIMKLFSTKACMDISQGCKVRKSIKKEGYDFGNIVSKFQALSVFDQQCITSQCSATVLDMLKSVANGSGNHLPLLESVSFLFDLMEIALNVYGLVEFVVQMVRELSSVDGQLQQKCSMVGRVYSTAIGLYIVGILYRYHNYVVVSDEDVLSVFDALVKLVRHVENPRECSSAERCIFFYINDLFLSCSFLLKKHQEPLSLILNMATTYAFPKDKESEVATCSVASPYNQSIMMQYLKNPKIKVDPSHIRKLNDSPEERYCFVFNAIVCTTETNDMDHLNDMAVLCAELTASCPNLSIEWLTAFKVLCNCTKMNSYSKLMSHMKISDRSIHDNLAVFLLILVARRCFLLDEFILIFVNSLLVPTLQDMNSIASESEPHLRLCCHLLMHLFKYYDSPMSASSSSVNSLFTSSSRYSLTSPGPLGISSMMSTAKSGTKAPFSIKYACDRYLLGGALNSLKIQLIITTMKAIFVLSTHLERKEAKSIFKSDKSEIPGSSLDDFMKGPRSGSGEFGDISFLSKVNLETGLDKQQPLAEFAKQVLKQVCQQDWIHDRCTRCFMDQPESSLKVMFDKKLTHKDAQHLLNMICYQKQMIQPALVNDKSDFKTTISQIFQNFDEWSLRISLMQLTMIYEQMKISTSYSQKDVQIWLETLASFVVEFFIKVSQNEPILDYSQLTLFTSKSTVLQPSSGFAGNNNVQSNNERVWLIVTLISKLPVQLQNELLKTTAKEMDSQQWICYLQATSSSISSKNKANFALPKSVTQNTLSINDQNSTTIMLSYQPFIALLQLCLAQKEGNKEAILNSLHNQIFQCKNEKVGEDVRVRKTIQDGLQLRLSLVGAMFDVIQSSQSFSNDWAVLFLNLISYTIVDPQIHYENFITILDMLNAVIHSAQFLAQNEQSQSQREDSKKSTGTILKKLRKELSQERLSLGLKLLKQLLPLPKLQGEAIQCQPIGTLIDTKNGKITGIDPMDKKHGLQVSEKQKFLPWDLIEGHKLQPPLSFTWFGGVKVEKKPMRMEENFVMLSRHSHDLHKPTSYYLEGPPLPPEDDPIPVQAPLPPVQAPPPQQQAPPPPPNPTSTLNMMLNNIGSANGPPVGPMHSGPLHGPVSQFNHPPPPQQTPSVHSGPGHIPGSNSMFGPGPMQNSGPPPPFNAPHQSGPQSMMGNSGPMGGPNGPQHGPGGMQSHGGNFPSHMSNMNNMASQQGMPPHGPMGPGMGQQPPSQQSMMVDGPMNQMPGPRPGPGQMGLGTGGLISQNNPMLNSMIDNHRPDMMMDTLPGGPPGVAPGAPGSQMLRPPIPMSASQPSPRGPAPKMIKAKAPRKKRAPKNAPNATPPLTGQQTPPIRMQTPVQQQQQGPFDQNFGSNQGPQQSQQQPNQMGQNWNQYQQQQQQSGPQGPGLQGQMMNQPQGPSQSFGGFNQAPNQGPQMSGNIPPQQTQPNMGMMQGGPAGPQGQQQGPGPQQQRYIQDPNRVGTQGGAESRARLRAMLTVRNPPPNQQQSQTPQQTPGMNPVQQNLQQSQQHPQQPQPNPNMQAMQGGGMQPQQSHQQQYAQRPMNPAMMQQRQIPRQQTPQQSQIFQQQQQQQQNQQQHPQQQQNFGGQGMQGFGGSQMGQMQGGQGQMAGNMQGQTQMGPQGQMDSGFGGQTPNQGMMMRPQMQQQTAQQQQQFMQQR